MEHTDLAHTLRIEPVENVAEPVLVRRKEVVQINQTSESFWRRFSGSLNAGSTYAKANETTQYSLGANADYLRERWTTGVSFNSTLTGSSGTSTSTRNNMTADYAHMMRWDNWFYTGIGSLLQSTEQNIQLQSNLGVGIGRFLKNTNHATINIFSGMAYQNTRYGQTDTAEPSQHTAAAMMGINAGLFRFDKTKLTLDATAFPALNQPGRMYTNVNTTYYLKFWGDFTWNISFYGNWDNQPPGHLSGSDYGTSLGLGWTFGNYNSYSK